MYHVLCGVYSDLCCCSKCGSATPWCHSATPSCNSKTWTVIRIIFYIPDTVCSTPQEHGCRGNPITFTKMWILASYVNLRIQFSIHTFRGRLYTYVSKNLSIYFISFVSSNWVAINHQKEGDWKCNQALILGFCDNDHAIRELIRFIEMTSRESMFEDDTQNGGAPNYKYRWLQTQRRFKLFYILNLSIEKAVL